MMGIGKVLFQDGSERATAKEYRWEYLSDNIRHRGGREEPSSSSSFWFGRPRWWTSAAHATVVSEPISFLHHPLFAGVPCTDGRLCRSTRQATRSGVIIPRERTGSGGGGGK